MIQNFYDILGRLNLKENHRILIVSGSLTYISDTLLKEGYKKLYLLDNKKSVYSVPYHTKIKCSYEKNLQLFYPKHFFNAIITNGSKFRKTMINFIQEGGQIIILNIIKNSSSKNKLSNKLSSLDRMAFTVTIGQNHILITKISKSSEINSNVKHRNVDILCYSRKEEGILVHSRILKSRLENELGFNVTIKHGLDEKMADVIIIEYHRNLKLDHELLQNIKELIRNSETVILETHSPIGSDLYTKLMGASENKLYITYRSSEVSEMDRANNYTILPVLSYTNIPKLEPIKTDKIRIGTFGFFGKRKGTLEVIELCLRLRIPAILLLGLSPLGSANSFEEEIFDLKKKFDKLNELNFCSSEEQNYIDVNKINILYGKFSDEQIIYFMSMCSHIAFSHRSRLEESGTIKYAKRLNRPIFALDSYQAKQGQVYIFKKFSKTTPFYVFKDSMTEAALNFLRRRISYKESISEILESFIILVDQLIFGKIPTLDEIKSLKAEDIMDDDGFEYLTRILKN